MSFPDPVRQRALVAAARHCCVSHRYGGVGVEAHHIVQEADGGADDDDNAIALCFDCDGAAGHYNPRHPRGTKYSPGELRLARERWHEMVSRGLASEISRPSGLRLRFIVGIGQIASLTPNARRELGFTGEIVLGSSPLSRFQQSAAWLHRNSDAEYADDDDYLRRQSAGRLVDGRELRFPGFHTVRPLGESEVAELRKSGEVCRLLLDAGIAIDDVAVAVGSIPVCGDGDGHRIYEEVLLRQNLAIDLAITNIGDAEVVVDRIVGSGALDARFWPFAYDSGYGGRVEFAAPRAPLSPGDTMVVPVMWLVGPFGYWHRQHLRGRSTAVVDEFGLPDETRLALAALGSGEVLGVVGPLVSPGEVHYSEQGASRVEVCHRFDPDRVYVTESGLECGSCPHAFALVAGEWRYLRPVLVACRRTPGLDVLALPPGASAVRIAELEYESTHLHEVSGVHLPEGGVVLERGEHLAFRPTGATVTLRGAYFPAYDGPESSAFRNQVVANYLRNLP